jgi:hypothetical protein
MIDLSDERLFALQQEYDELEAALLERLPEFRLYLASRDHDDNGMSGIFQPTPIFSDGKRSRRSLSSTAVDCYS